MKDDIPGSVDSKRTRKKNTKLGTTGSSKTCILLREIRKMLLWNSRLYIILVLSLMLISSSAASEGEDVSSEKNYRRIRSRRGVKEEKSNMNALRKMEYSMSMSMSMNYFQTYSMAYSMSMSYSYQYQTVDAHRKQQSRRTENQPNRRHEWATLTKSGQKRIETLINDLQDPSFWQND